MKDTGYYRALPYTRVVRLVEDEGPSYFLASIEELPGVRADGKSEVEARAALTVAFEDYIAAMLTWGRPIPAPALWPESLGFTAPTTRLKRNVEVEGVVFVGSSDGATPTPVQGGARWIDRDAGRVAVHS